MKQNFQKAQHTPSLTEKSAEQVEQDFINYHEAGHVVAAYVNDIELEYASNIAAEQSAGRVVLKDKTPREDNYQALLQILFGGMCATTLFVQTETTEHTERAADDWDMIAALMQYFEETDGKNTKEIQQHFNDIIGKKMLETMQLLKRNAHYVQEIATALNEKRTINTADIAAIMSKPQPPLQLTANMQITNDNI